MCRLRQARTRSILGLAMMSIELLLQKVAISTLNRLLSLRPGALCSMMAGVMPESCWTRLTVAWSLWRFWLDYIWVRRKTLLEMMTRLGWRLLVHTVRKLR